MPPWSTRTPAAPDPARPAVLLADSPATRRAGGAPEIRAELRRDQRSRCTTDSSGIGRGRCQAHGVIVAMRLFVAAFAAGIWFLQQQAALPSFAWLAGLGAGGLLLLVLQQSALAPRRYVASGLLVAGAASLGFVWAATFAQLRLADELPAVLEGRDIELTGVVAGLPQELERGVRFTFDVEQAVVGVPPRISLAWYRGRDDAMTRRKPAGASARRRALALHGAPQAPARQPESPRLRLRGVAVRARHPRHRVRASRAAPRASRRGSGGPATRWRCCAKPSATAFAPCCPTRRMPAS
jgi:hypothetical protein